MKTINEHKRLLSEVKSKTKGFLTKKEHERFIIEKFVSNPELNLIVTSIQDNETPDFIVKTLDKKISMEITGLYNPILKEEEEFNKSIIEKAESLFKEKYQDNLDVLLSFIPDAINCKKTETYIYAEKIYKIVEKIYLSNKEFDFKIKSKEGVSVNEFISSLVVTNEWLFSYWQTYGAHIVEHIDSNWLKDIIIGKEKKIEEYKGSFDENWLILVSNFGWKSSANRFDSINIQDLKTKFAKVFVYKYFENSIVTIK